MGFISGFKGLISVRWEPNCSMLADGRTDGQTDMTNLIAAFRNFAKATKNQREAACYDYDLGPPEQ
jgi:hypothetical protein